MAFKTIQKTKNGGAKIVDCARISVAANGKATAILAPSLAERLGQPATVFVMVGEGSDAGHLAIVPAGQTGRALYVQGGRVSRVAFPADSTSLRKSTLSTTVPHEWRETDGGEPMLVLDIRSLIGIRAVPDAA